MPTWHEKINIFAIKNNHCAAWQTVLYDFLSENGAMCDTTAQRAF
jgi:hypothetical protein